MAYLDQNSSADKTVHIIAELIKSGRYSNPNVGINQVIEESNAIKAALENLYKS